MPTRYDGLKDGRAIAKKVREDMARSGVVMDLLRKQDDLPVEYRARIRQEETSKLRATLAEGRKAMDSWAQAEADDARKRLRADDVGSPAEESRRVADEFRIARLVDSAHASGNERNAAADLAERADRAYSQGNLGDAQAFARASAELVPSKLATDVQALVRYDRIAADPGLARASRELDDVGVVMAAFARDSQAEYSHGLQDSASLATALGENQGKLASEAASASVSAKMSAWIGAQEHGGTYEEPRGSLPGLAGSMEFPLGSPRFPQPPGAKLPMAKGEREITVQHLAEGVS